MSDNEIEMPDSDEKESEQTLGQNEALTSDEILRLALSEISVAEDYADTRADRRGKAWDRYYGRNLGNEVKGRSQFITREVMDTIEWMMPYFLHQFAAGDPKIKIEIEGQPPYTGQVLMEKIHTDFNRKDSSFFLLLYQWVKDALVSDTSYVKLSWNRDQKEVDTEFFNLTRQNLGQIEADPDIEVTSFELTDENSDLWEVKATVTQTIKDELKTENTPHWEFIVDPKAREIDDEWPKGHKTEVTLDYLKRINRQRGGEFFNHLAELEGLSAQGQEDVSATTEALTYAHSEGLLSSPESEKGPRAPIAFYEWYSRMDVDGDGYLEPVVCYIGNRKLLRWELNEEEVAPFAALKPIIDCYKFYGIAYADLLIEIQNLKTMLLRRILDLFDYQVSGRWRVDPQGNVDLQALFANVPGSTVTGKKDAIEDLSPKPFQPAIFSILEYVDTIKENRTGITRYNQGMDAGTLNQTATGIMAIQSAAMQRLELIARIFAETGIKEFYRKAVKLYQRHMEKPFIAKVAGQDHEITREMIQGEVLCVVNMGVEASIGQQESQKLEKLTAYLTQMNEKFPGLLGPEQVHNISQKYAKSLGYRQGDEFMTGLQAYMQRVTQVKQQQSETQQAMMQLQQQVQQIELALKQKEIEVKAAKTVQQKEISDTKLAQKERESIRETEQLDRDSQRKFQLGYFDAIEKGLKEMRPE